MRNQSVLLSLVLVALGACANQGGGPGLSGYDDKRPECQPAAAPKKVKINVTKDDFGVQPPRLCVSPGDIIEFQVVGNPHQVRVDVASKPITPAGWLSGSTSSRLSTFEVHVPADAIGTYFYDIAVPGFGRIDPMISVDR